MQVVFVHGVNTRDLGDGDYQRWVEGRSDRLKRLAFGGKADIRNPYWGQFGLAAKSLKSLPSAKDGFSPSKVGATARKTVDDVVIETAKTDFIAVVASFSATEIAEATQSADEVQRRKVEDFWMDAIAYAEDNPHPEWLGEVSSVNALRDRLQLAVDPNAKANTRALGKSPVGTRKLSLPSFDGNAFAAERARALMSSFLAQFLGDALMFFSRRDKSAEVRRTVAKDIVAAAREAKVKSEPLVLVGYSMGGGILHELLTDAETVAAMEAELAGPLKVDLFLSVGTQIGLFAELQQFVVPDSGSLLMVPVSHYWNIFDYHDTLAFLCGSVLPGVADFDVSTAAGVVNAHGAYFDSALFFKRLNAKLIDAGLV